MVFWFRADRIAEILPPEEGFPTTILVLRSPAETIEIVESAESVLIAAGAELRRAGDPDEA